jgi:hypothetical protein
VWGLIAGCDDWVEIAAFGQERLDFFVNTCRLRMGLPAMIRFKALVAQEDVNYTYGTKIARLMLLSPDIIEKILTEQAPRGLTLAECLRPFPLDWRLQRVHFGIA